MTVFIGMVSQKGGVGKSTLSRLIAREYADAGWSVKIADLDVSQGTCFDWQSRRLEHVVTPDVPVERFGNISQALKVAHVYDLLIFDGKPYATSQTLDIAKSCDLLILPTGLSLDDLRPSVLLGYFCIKPPMQCSAYWRFYAKFPNLRSRTTTAKSRSASGRSMRRRPYLTIRPLLRLRRAITMRCGTTLRSES